ncbi:MAG: HAMP domain-containing histidine kinase, partial [bacterium]|nr:HAMP domain-containing histidine kinase [bacterium]
KPYTQVTPFFCKFTEASVDSILAMNVLQIKKKLGVFAVVVQLRKAEREVNLGEMKSLFVSFAAHQLKTPSSIVKGFLELLMREGQKSYSADQWNFLISAFESNEHLIHVSKTLLSLARLEGGLIAPQIQSFDPRLLLQSKIKSMQSLLDLKNIKVTFESTDKGFLNSDQGFFLEIFEILFANAIKHSGDKPQLKITCTTTKQGTEVHVMDNGPGISAVMQDKLFKTAADAQPDNNTHGLGLYMTKKYIALLGGFIGVFSEGAGKGSDFYFSVPNAE